MPLGRDLRILTKSPKIASWPGILVSHKETRTKVVLAKKLGKQGHGSSPASGTLQPIRFLKAHDVSYPNSDENTNTKTKTVTKTMTKTKTPRE